MHTHSTHGTHTHAHAHMQARTHKANPRPITHLLWHLVSDHVFFDAVPPPPEGETRVVIRLPQAAHLRLVRWRREGRVSAIVGRRATLICTGYVYTYVHICIHSLPCNRLLFIAHQHVMMQLPTQMAYGMCTQQLTKYKQQSHDTYISVTTFSPLSPIR